MQDISAQSPQSVEPSVEKEPAGKPETMTPASPGAEALQPTATPSATPPVQAADVKKTEPAQQMPASSRRFSFEQLRVGDYVNFTNQKVATVTALQTGATDGIVYVSLRFEDGTEQYVAIDELQEKLGEIASVTEVPHETEQPPVNNQPPAA